MLQFDYKTAHDELAAPAFRMAMEIPEVATAFKAVIEHAPSLSQNNSLLVPMPTGLQPLFDAIDTHTLSAASRIMFFAGHWACGDWKDADPFRMGAHWKFSNLADQVLSQRLGIRTSRTWGGGVDYTITEGILRISISTQDCGMNIEVGPAITGVLRLATEAKPSDHYPFDGTGKRGRGIRRTRDAWVDRMEARAKRIKADVGPWDGLLTGWDNTDRFMK